MDSHNYEVLYEAQARADQSEHVIGAGDYDLIGRTELALLRMTGLMPHHSLVDFGCGTGRLAVHAVPYLVGGGYTGIDITDVYLQRAGERVLARVPAPPCRLAWVKQAASRFALGDGTADMICAFSVFTHMEHEDSYLYLKDARRVIRPGGRFVFSCLPLDLAYSRDVFLGEAAMDLGTRWSRPRNVVTSIDLMTEVARMAGWAVIRWYAGDEPNIAVGEGEAVPLGQSSCVLGVPG